MRYFIKIVFILFVQNIFSQEIPEHISSVGVYDFIDELALEGVIEPNDVVKPYTDKSIYNYLNKAKIHLDKLNKRQILDLEFYLKEFSYFEPFVSNTKTQNSFIDKYLDQFNLSLYPLGYRYKDSLFYLDIRPIWGIDYYKNDKGTNYHRWGGGLLKMNMGKHFSGWASLRDNNLSEVFNRKEYFTTDRGGNFKGSKSGGGDFSEMRGGVAYSWDWGSLSMSKDHVEWGSNYHGANILSPKAPSFAQIKLHLKPAKWADFNYMHGWLVSNVIDSVRSYITRDGNRRDVMHPKYVAANMFTIFPFKGINFSFGNSIIYSDMNPHPAYLIPFMFFKSVDHWLNSTDDAGVGVGQNSQMFINLSIKRLMHFNFYASVFIDELKVARINEKDKYNLYSYKIGAKYSNGFISNMALTAEYTKTTPGTYQHYISTTTFESSSYNLGHYLRDNSDELYFAIAYKPFSEFRTVLEYTKARHGNSFKYIHGNDIITHAALREIKWTNEIIGLSVSYEFPYNNFIKLAFIYNNAKGDDLKLFTPDFYQGENKTIVFGINMGF